MKTLQLNSQETLSPIHRGIGILLLGLILMISAGGCKGTAHGAGKDIEKMGEKIQEKTD
jgi:predicted small secreted protein